MSRAERGAIPEPLVLALGAVTSLVVLATTTVAVLAATADEPPTERPSSAVRSGASSMSSPSSSGEASPSVPVPSGPDPVFPDGQFVYGEKLANVVFQVPAEYIGWELESSSVVYFFERPNGDLEVKVKGPAAYNTGTCPDNGNSTTQAYVGVSAISDESQTTLEDAQARMTRRWSRAVRRDDEGGGPPAPVTGPQTREVTTASGQPALRSSVVVTTAGRTCAPPKTQIVVQTTDVGASLTTVVMVRDAGTLPTLPAETAREIMDSIDAEIVPE